MHIRPGLSIFRFLSGRRVRVTLGIIGILLGCFGFDFNLQGGNPMDAVGCPFGLDLSFWPLLPLKTSRLHRVFLNFSGFGNPGWRGANRIQSARIISSV